MTPLERVYMLNCNTCLTFENMMKIYRTGYTRIPVYDGRESNIIGILYSKDLILINPDDGVKVKSVLAFHGMNHAQFVPEQTSLHEILSRFKHSYTHLMIAVASKGDCQKGGAILQVLF